jgi:hypothetical protein
MITLHYGRCIYKLPNCAKLRAAVGQFWGRAAFEASCFRAGRFCIMALWALRMQAATQETFVHLTV